jgi:hypothetical protein
MRMVGRICRLEELQYSFSCCQHARLVVIAVRLTLYWTDRALGEAIEALGSSDSYTLVYISSPAQALHEAQSQEVNEELRKRGPDYIVANPSAGNKTEWDKLPLFDKYVFFNTGT